VSARAVASGIRIDPVLVVVASLAFGAAGAVAPAATAVAAIIALAALGRRLERRALLFAVLALCAGSARASWQLSEHARRFELARQLLPAPNRCAARGRVTSSPTWLDGTLRVDAELTALDCEGRFDQQVWPARLHLPGQRTARPALRDPSHVPRDDHPPIAGSASPLSGSDPRRAGADDHPLARGDEFSVVADLAPVSEFRNLLLPDPRPSAARRGALLSGGALSFELEARASGVRAWIDRARGHVRDRILATFSARVSGMARALVLGENDLDPDDDRAFQRSGLSHLLAVSGTHLILAVLALLRGVEAIARRAAWLSSRLDVRRPVALLGCCLGPLYADFAGGSGSAWRAAWMLCAVLGVRAAGRHVFPSRVLAASLAVGWLCDGLVVFDPSFSLSVAATSGLLAFGQRHESQLIQTSALTEPRRPDLGRLATAVSHAALTTLAATLPCVPILLSISPGLSLASVAANLLAAPLGEAVALPLCLAHALCAPLPPLERGLALVASGALGLIRAVAHGGASVEWLYFRIPPPSEWHQAAVVAGVSACLAAGGRAWLGPSERRAPGACNGPGAASATARAAMATLLALVAIEGATRWRHSAARARQAHRLRVTALDVGQGDATLVDLPDGRLMLIDGGGFVGIPIDPGERVILPTLRARRRDRVDILVLTHPHPDHYGGLASVVREVDIGEFWYGGADEDAGSSHAELVALLRQQGVPMRTAAELCQNDGHVGAGIRLLHPCPTPSPAPSANDASLVLRVSHGEHSALFLGDAEHWAEQRLIATRADALDADFLKVGHHGSRTSSSAAFLARVTPSVASISAGIRNRFGHPHREALSALAAAGAHILRLDQTGAASWESDGAKASVATFAPEPAR